MFIERIFPDGASTRGARGHAGTGTYQQSPIGPGQRTAVVAGSLPQRTTSI